MWAIAAGTLIALLTTSCTNKKANAAPEIADTQATRTSAKPEISTRTPSNEVQTTRQPAAEERPSARDPSSFSAQLSFANVADTGFTDQPGEFGYSRTGLELELPFLDVAYQRYDFSWSDAQSLDFSDGSGEPWSELQSLSLSTNQFVPLRENLGMMFGIGATMGWEDDTSDAISYDAAVGLMWQKSATFQLFAGVAYNWHPKVDLRFDLFPMLGLSWNEHATKGWSAAFGFPNTELRYAFNETSSLALALNGDGGLFRRADRAPAIEGGFVEWTRFGAGLSYRHHLTRRWAFVADVNYGFENEWRFYDADGHHFSTEDADESFGFNLSFSVDF
ncbi:DUF6268 domain-containing protein [Sulfidibacter corallicola]|uniref:Uncharacterized protein n=1 Tax=Sulfidibacter corallicola TaxID=2818388 RepID=A0A8A4TQM2_SULCO|nr:DUF6268 family outer membrane beta-barrel protein [Sulfidibacter corallicola]QTD51717.1 hypothetical protein J3U87_04540 [Sulfidibacter corallicola]